MESQTLPKSAASGKRVSFVEQIARLFVSRPGCWISSDQLSAVGGRCAWRTRIADARRPPYSLQIENRQRRVRANDQTVTVSEYRLVTSKVDVVEPTGTLWSTTP